MTLYNIKTTDAFSHNLNYPLYINIYLTLKLNTCFDVLWM